MPPPKLPPGTKKPVRGALSLYANSPTIAQTRKPATIKAPPAGIVSNAMTGLHNPRSQSPSDRQSVDGRVGAEAAAVAKVVPKAKPKTKSKPRPNR
jgi:hypothetical protein